MKKFYLKVGLLFILTLTTTFVFTQNKITSFPYTESFESGFGDWIQSTDDVLDWTWNTGGTPSTGTGPYNAYDGSYYIYTEATSNFNNDAYLDASFDLSGLTHPVFSFYYHMYGAKMGSLHIDIWDGAWNQDAYVLSGQQQIDNLSSWKNAYIDLTDFAGNDSIVVRLRGITGIGYTSDICIDHIEVFDGTDMSINTIQIIQPNTNNVYQNTKDNTIALVEIETNGVLNPLSLDTFYLNSNGTTNLSWDVTEVNIYYTYNDSFFYTHNLFASESSLQEPLVGSKTLIPGKNYFWVTYDISKTAIVNNFVDVECDSISIVGISGNQIPGITAPAGNRKIVKDQKYYNFMPANIVVGQPDFYTQNTSVDEYSGIGSNNSAISSKGVLAVGSQSAGRILIWNKVPDTNGTPADIVLGNPDFYTINDGPTDAYMDYVDGICFSPDGEKLIASDAGNNRVLIWNSIPATNAQSADVVIGQTDFTSSYPGIGPDKLDYPAGVIVTPDGKLLINEFDNNRVLVYNQIPTTNGASADLVIGQKDFYSNSEGIGPGKLNTTWYSAVSPDGKLLIADEFNNRILIYNEFPTQNGDSADVVIGQINFFDNSSGTSNRKLFYPIGVTVSPSGKLAIGEFANNRVLIYNEIPDTNGAPADYVLGQPDFNSNTAFNGGVSNKSMYHPYGINFDLNGRLFVNGRDMNRVMIYGDLPLDTADISISISANKTNPLIGESIAYTFTLSNNGPNSSLGVIVKCALPGVFKLDSYGSGKGEYHPYGGTWNIPYIGSGESIELILNGTIKDGGDNTTAYSNIVASEASDNNMNNNAASLTIDIINEAPTITEFTADTIEQDGSSGWIPFTVSDTDSDISKLKVRAVSSDDLIISDDDIEFMGEGENRYIKISHYSSFFIGAVDISVIVSDGYNQSQSNFELYVIGSEAYLESLDTSGTIIAGFWRFEFNYTCELAAGATIVPTVGAVALNPKSQVTISETDTLPGITTIEVIAEDGKTIQEYLVTFVFPVNANNDASLTDLQVEGETVDGFSPIRYNYAKSLPYSTSFVPSISATAKNGAATIDIRKTIVLPGRDSIIVTATDGVTEQVYTIDYLLSSASNNNNLEVLWVDPDELEMFDPDVLSYTIEYPYGTTDVPFVFAFPEDDNASIDQTDAVSMPGTTTIEVTAEDGVTSKTYSVNFTLVAVSHDATLKDLEIDASTIFGFEPAIYSYDIQLGNTIAQVPVVNAETNHSGAIAVITYATSIPGTTSVVVTAQNGTTTLSYDINFSYEPLSDVSLLSNLKVNGITVNGFDPEVFDYTIKLPVTTTILPTVTATVYDLKATMAVNKATTIPGTTTVTVTAEDGYSSDYHVNFSFENLSSDATLSDLLVDGTIVPGFSSGTYTYSMGLPFGTSDVPSVTATKNDANAELTITEATSLPGSTTVVVTAQDEVTQLTYTIHFTLATNLSNDATLSDLKVNGATITGFGPSISTYNIELAEGTTTVPTVTATTNNGNASYIINNASSLPGNTTIVVTAENGITSKTYRINFTIATSISELDDDFSITMYPNPSHGSIFIEFNHAINKPCQIEVFNLIGGLVHSKKLTKIHKTIYEINLSNLSKGMYFVKMSTNTESYVKSIMIQ